MPAQTGTGLAPSPHQRDAVTPAGRQTGPHYQPLAGDQVLRVCVSDKARSCAGAQVEPSAADMPRQASLLRRTPLSPPPLASGGENLLIGKGRNTHTHARARAQEETDGRRRLALFWERPEAVKNSPFAFL